MAAPSYQYPPVHRSDHQDTLHGKVVADPYRWLEDPDSPETEAFVTAQNELTQKVFQDIPYRKEFLARNTELFNYEKYSSPFQRGGRYFYFKNDGLQNQSVLYVQDTLTSEPKVLLDPNTLAEDGTAALGTYNFSEGKSANGILYFGYGVSKGGSDWQTLKLIAIHADGTVEHLQDTVEWVKFSGVEFTHDDGFFYGRYPVPKSRESGADGKTAGTETDLNENPAIYYHKIGTPQTDDKFVFSYPQNPKYYLSASLSDDGKYLQIYVIDGCKDANILLIADLAEAQAFIATSSGDQTSIPVREVVSNMDFSYHYLLNNGPEFYFVTNLDAPRKRIVKVDNILSDTIVWTEVIPEGSDVLSSAHAVRNDLLVVEYLKDASDTIRLYTQSGEFIRNIALPSIGTVGVSCKRDSPELFFKFISFLYPGTIYREDLTDPSTSSPAVFREATVPGFSPEDFEAKQVWYPSKDGTQIPMFLVSKKNLARNGDTPTYLYGYGGVNISLTPSFSASRIIFVQHFNGLLALPSLRGGGEYGKAWHQAGTLGNKQNVFDDFQGAAEYLIKEGYTNSSKIAIHGGSNGGLLVAACANQRPDLFRCAVGAVGVMDMLRFHKFTIGHGWTTDYGNPDKAEDFEFISKYSPLHNVPSFEAKSTGLANDHGGFPAYLLTTGDHDDRVVPLHSLKLIAEVQHKLGHHSSQTNPLLIRVETNAGHGAGKPTSKILQEAADVYTYIGWALGATFV
ncbi:hypothetical protein DYB37_004127 [Aphanomyces astaci]|uniref:Prolyl endopeptidase n=1 Tax=Aphanomyces astaci TaxID=112090 RepID=A0A3R6YLM6_APHAT|nr:hypothetical protein DYB37_004127 [Aphanomyces astaci]